MDRESPGLGLSLTPAARRPMAPLPIDSVRRGGDMPPTIAAEEWHPGLGNEERQEARITPGLGNDEVLFSADEKCTCRF